MSFLGNLTLAGCKQFYVLLELNVRMVHGSTKRLPKALRVPVAVSRFSKAASSLV